MKKLAFKIHLWLSLPIGLIITIVCLTGSILVFEDELLELLHPERFQIEKTSFNKPLVLNELIPLVNKQLTNNSVVSVKIPSKSNRSYEMGLKEGFRVKAYVNPYTGELLGIQSFRGAFFTKVMQLHRWLLDDNRKTGKAIVGYSTLLLVFILITGLILWFPKSKKQFKHRVQINKKYGKKRFWMDLHIVGGFYLAIGLLILSLTGLHYSFSWYRTGLYSLFASEAPARGNQQQKQIRGNKNQKRKRHQTDSFINENENTNSSYLAWDRALNIIKKEYTSFGNITIQEEKITISPASSWGNIRATDHYLFDSSNGKIIDSIPYKEQSRASKISGWIYTLHVGAWGGWFSKVITCLIALISASLPLTGYYIFFTKRKRKWSKNNR